MSSRAPTPSSSSGPLRAGSPVRTLPNVLRVALADRALVRFEVGEVAAIPDDAHVTVTVGDGTVTVPRLASYTPTINEPVFLLTSALWTLAIGTVPPPP